MEQLIDIYNKMNNYGSDNQMTLESVTEGFIVYKMEIQEKHLATPVAAHGGSVAGFMDAIIGVAALSVTAKHKKLVSTVEFKINYFKPVLLGNILTGTGKILSEGKRIIVAQGEIKNEEGELVAFATGTFNAYPYEKVGLKL